MTKILIVDDDRRILKEMKDFLIRRGFEVIHSSYGMDIIQTLKKDTSIDLILLDYSLPDIHVNVIFEAMQILNIETPVILMAGPVTLRLNHIPNNVYITKPVDLNNLLEKISEVLNGV